MPLPSGPVRLAAVDLLGRPDGFLGNPQLRIPLPGYLEDAAKLLRATGQGAKVDELFTAMNRAAEAAVPQARALLVQTVKGLVKGDAATIEQHVTARALDALYRVIGQEEKKLRADPLGAGSDLLRRVFGR